MKVYWVLDGNTRMPCPKCGYRVLSHYRKGSSHVVCLADVCDYNA